jgi:hypothetical protein
MSVVAATTTLRMRGVSIDPVFQPAGRRAGYVVDHKSPAAAGVLGYVLSII